MEVCGQAEEWINKGRRRDLFITVLWMWKKLEVERFCLERDNHCVTLLC